MSLVVKCYFWWLVALFCWFADIIFNNISTDRQLLVVGIGVFAYWYLWLSCFLVIGGFVGVGGLLLLGDWRHILQHFITPACIFTEKLSQSQIN